MFESKVEINEAIDKVHAACASLNRGDVLPHTTVAGILGYQPHEGRWDYVVHKALRRLEDERGIAYLPLQGVGYRLLTMDEQLSEMSHRTKRARA